ncbi:unnamed protein product [Camellia sinensis]
MWPPATVPPPPPTPTAAPPFHHHSMPMENPNRLSNNEFKQSKIHPYHPQCPPATVPPPPPTPTAAPPLHHHSMPMENPNHLSNDEVRSNDLHIGPPEDVKERELQNLLRWLPRYKASQVNCKGEHPMGFALFTTPPFAIATKDALQEMVFDEESKSVLHTEMAKKNLFVKRDVASWGAYLFKKNVIAMSFAPRDSHEAQVQFALERGVPAIIGVLGTIKLPYPSRAFDMAHGSRCLIPWGGNGPPINWRVNYEAWQRPKEELEEEQRKIEEIAKFLCWEKKHEKGEIAIGRKRVNKEYCFERESRATMCDSTNPDDACERYKKMEIYVTPYLATNGPDEVAEEPVASMDNSGKIIWAKHNEIQTVNIRSVGADYEVTGGERLPLVVKELGTCDLYPQCSRQVPVVLIGWHDCHIEAQIERSLDAQMLENEKQCDAIPAEKKKVKSTKPNPKKVKKEKKAKDPNQPKRPQTAFFLLMSEFRKTYKEANPDCKSVATVAKEGGEKWKSMTDEIYLDRAAELKAEYDKALNSDKDVQNADDKEDGPLDKEAQVETVSEDE